MEASTVYYTDFRCPVGTSLTDKLRRLCIAAGIKNIDMEASSSPSRCISASWATWPICAPTTPRWWPTCARSRAVCPS